MAWKEMSTVCRDFGNRGRIYWFTDWMGSELVGFLTLAAQWLLYRIKFLPRCCLSFLRNSRESNLQKGTLC